MIRSPGCPEIPLPGNRLEVAKAGVLIVDDKALVLALLKYEMEQLGLSPWLASNGNDAIDLYRRHHDRISVVILNAQMSELDGPHTLAAMRWLNPDIIACFMSSDDDRYSIDDLLDRGAVCVFGKSTRPAEIARFLQRLLTPADSNSFICDRMTGAESVASAVAHPNDDAEALVVGQFVRSHIED